MSTSRTGGTSLRLVTGLTCAALIVSGVIAANMRSSHRLTQFCTLAPRNTSGSTIVAGDVYQVNCSGLSANSVYRLYVPSSDVSGWSSMARHNGTGGSPLEAMPTASDGTRTYLRNGANSYTFTTDGSGNIDTAHTPDPFYIQTASGASLTGKTLNLYNVGTATDLGASTNSYSTVDGSSSGFATTPITGGISDAQLNLVGIQAGESYALKITSGAAGFDASGQAGDGSMAHPYQFDSSTHLTSPTTSMSSSPYEKTVSPGSSVSATLALTDSDGNTIFEISGLTIN